MISHALLRRYNQDTGKEKGGIVRGIGKAFRKATGAIGKGVGVPVGGAVNVLVKPT